MKRKLLLILFIFNTLLHANCTYDLNIDFDFSNKQIKVNANIYDRSKSVNLKLDNFQIDNISKLQSSLDKGANKVAFSYTKTVKDLNKEYVYLLNSWYPTIDTKCTYTINTTLPSSYKSVYKRTKKEIDKATFIASKKFIINSKSYNDISIKTYFLRQDNKLSQAYLNKSIEYIKLYESKIGSYPFKEFSVVENIYQTGYSMPTFTLIGSRLLKKPYILEQSLGHEILHQYFGNSVFNDFKEGNWVEGLTTYLADDYYKKVSKTDINHRKSILHEYHNFVNSNNDFAISEFQSRFDKASMLIGYSKFSFIFHMLENKIGSQQFNTIIKKLYKEYQFKEINIKELASFFENNSKVNLKSFFEQWLNQKGQIDFSIENIKTFYDKNGFALTFDVMQEEDNFFAFDLPINIKTYEGDNFKNIAIHENRQTIKLNFSSEILEVVFDEKINLFRKLTQKEIPLSISSIMVEKDLIAVVNKEDIKKYESIKNIFPQIKIIESNALKFKDLKDNSVVFLDVNNSVLPQIYPNIDIEKNNSYLSIKPHIYNQLKRMAVLNFGLYKSHYFRMIKHYSKYKEIIFTKDTVLKKSDTTDNGISIELNQMPHITKIEKKNPLNTILEHIENKQIIYVGESHTNFSHHLNQLRVIKTLHESGKKVSIGMEMFQMPFQKDVDEYIQGTTTLEEFLENSQYFKRWKFDYNLYKPIMDYARKNKLPVVALNIDRTITKQVSKQGLFSLSQEQRKLLPKLIDQSNLSYKKSLDSIFKEHMPTNTKVSKNNPHSAHKANLDFYYQAQLIWDEVMAQNIAAYMNTNPKRVLVVLAGAGHIQKHDGIPSRVYKRNQLPYKVLLNDVSTSKNGDILIHNVTKTDIPKQSKLGTYLKDNKDMTVLNTVKESFSQKIGIKKNDKILEINGKKIENIYDIKRSLYFIDDLKEARIKINRGNKILELPLK